MKNHYEILEIVPTASSEEIDKAYHKLSKQFHPDNNGGVTYFDNLYLQIKEAHSILSNEEIKVVYDKANSFNQEEVEPEEEKLNSPPQILNFEVDKDTFEEGDNIRLTWETKNADKVLINPFGEVEATGSKIYRLKNYNKPSLTVSLQITNSVSGETLNKSLNLTNKVTEIDFSILNKTETEEENLGKKEDPLMHYNYSKDTANSTKEDEESFFSSRGRLRRSSYLMRLLLLAVPAALVYVMLENSSDFYGYDENTLVFSGLVLIAISFFSILQFIKRLHDITLSGWWALLSFIPYVGGLFGLVVLFIDSSKGSNKYGKDPKHRP